MKCFTASSSPCGSIKKTAIAVLMLATSLATAPAHADICATSYDQNALGSRVLQSRLMVAALSCNQRTTYNVIMQTYKAEFAADNKALGSFFSRSYGARGHKELNAFATRMANDASAHSMKNIAAFCNASGHVFQALMSPGQHNYQYLRAQFNDPVFHGYKTCVQRSATQQ